ncbi:hypothetical protein BDW02DRAFT_174990 [Decorospora gaudefroyi]|uniref:Uncharacterized protein n=1 Tax=Decorospora gaudefroyi TaxID=184978 RepID=A0A6A5KN37_9PLEO|nr:hypothetical protein BDW02DRAFT_174990 [Decorospora gaudefroyi]
MFSCVYKTTVELVDPQRTEATISSLYRKPRREAPHAQDPPTRKPARIGVGFKVRHSSHVERPPPSRSWCAPPWRNCSMRLRFDEATPDYYLLAAAIWGWTAWQSLLLAVHCGYSEDYTAPSFRNRLERSRSRSSFGQDILSCCMLPRQGTRNIM